MTHLRLSRLLDWRRVVVYSHRWLGIAGSLLFVGWFVSGVVMVYARMPRLPAEERLMRARPLDLQAVRIAPADAAGSLGKPVDRLRIGMAGRRPVYRFYDGRLWSTVYADTGEPLSHITVSEALSLAAIFAPARASTLSYTGHLTVPDQWTLQIRALLPMHRIALGDAEGTCLYLSERTGEPVLKTTRETRLWGYLGAVVHWIYFTPIRQHGDAWAQLIIWTSIAGCVLCILGLVWGVWRYSPSQRFRLRRVHSHTPYAGMMRWHHYAGLVFGVVAFTWIFSGLLSMNPWNWSPGTSPSPEQRRAVAGGLLRIADVRLPQLQRAVARLSDGPPVKEIELLQFRGALFAESYGPPASHQVERFGLADPGAVVASRVPLPHKLISLTDPDQHPMDAFDEANLMAAAREALPGVPIEDVVWLHSYDAYYYDRSMSLPLPVLRVRYADSVNTWLYFNPRRGEIVRKEERLTRVNRWLYHGLHSLDFPGLYQRRPLWDIVVISLSVGGLLVSVSSAPAAWRRLRRHARLIGRTGRSRRSRRDVNNR